MELELKHIVGYLPYQTNFICTRNRISILDTYIGICAGKNIIDIGYVINNNLKPILRPLSDLTKEIEVNGEKFVPIKKLGWEYYDGELGGMAYCVYGESPRTTVNVIDYLDDLEKLYEWHFDIHGLIEKGLAIDLNTLNNGIQ